MRAIYKAAVAAILVGSTATIACSTPADDAGSNESNATADPKAKKIKAATEMLNGAWRNETEGQELLALILTGTDFGDEVALRVERDTKHTKQRATDRDEANRTSFSGKVVSVASDTSGTVEFVINSFTDNDVVRTTETYAYEVKSAGGKDTLTLKETEETSTTSRFDAEDNAGPPKVTKNPVKAPFSLTRAASWCVVTFDGNAVDDCQGQFGSVWKPTDTPAKCKGSEGNCMRCDPTHACHMIEVSSCELDGKSCFKSVAACEFQDGIPAGQVSRVSGDGKAINCDNSPSRNGGICCENIFSGRGDEGDD